MAVTKDDISHSVDGGSLFYVRKSHRLCLILVLDKLPLLVYRKGPKVSIVFSYSLSAFCYCASVFKHSSCRIDWHLNWLSDETVSGVFVILVCRAVELMLQFAEAETIVQMQA